jgi:hypothetical protein
VESIRPLAISAALPLKALSILCTVTLVIVVPALPQAVSSLTGHVADPTGAAITGAKVTLFSLPTGNRREDVTNGQGDYQFQQLEPNRYSLTVTAPNFATFTQENIELFVASPAAVNVTLQVGSTTQQVTVVEAAVAPLFNTTNATLGNVFTAQQIPELPLEGRDVLLLLSLQPGVGYLGQQGNSADDTRSGAVNGARSDQSNVTLDGIEVNDENFGYSFDSVLGVTQESVSEFRVITSNAGADAGHSSGGEVAMITRSGTNHLHGAAYEYNRTTPFSANDWFNKENQIANDQPNRATELIRNVFGVAIGGPVKKDRLFFFTNYEGTRLAQSAPPQIVTVPTATLRRGIVQYTSTVGDNIALTPAQIQGMDPQGIGVDPAALQVLNSYPLPNSTLAGDNLNFSGFQFAAPQHSSFNTYIARLDWIIRQNHSVFWRGNLINDDQPSPPQFPGQPPASTLLTNSKGYALGYTAILRPNLVNDFRWGLTRQGSSSAGISNQPQISLAGLPSPTAYTRTSSFIIPVNNLVDNLSWGKGRHNLQFGTNVRFIDDQQVSTQNSYSSASGTIGWLHPATIANGGVPLDPAYSGYPAVSTGSQSFYNGAIADVVGLITMGTAIYNYTKDGTALALGVPVQRDYRWHELEFYGQDNWKPLPALTLTLGLRYSYQQVPAERSGTQVGPCIATGGGCTPYSLTQYVRQSSLQGATGGAASNVPSLSFAPNGRYNGKPDFWNSDKADFSPRLSFAYAPHASEGFWKKLVGIDGQSSIRGGYSLIYDHFGAGVVNAYNQSGSYGLTDMVENPPGSLTTTTAPRFEGLATFPAGLLPSAPSGGFPATPPTSGRGSFAISWGLDNAIHTPYSHLFDLSFQRQLSASNLLEVAYVGRLAHRLLEQEDVAAPLDLVTSQDNYFDAATRLSMMARQKVPVTSVAPIPYWQNLFGALQDVDTGQGYGPLSATQNVYVQYLENVGDETSALNALDEPNGGLGAGTLYPAYRFFHSQYSSLYAYRSIGQSYYNGLQVIFHHRASHGLQVDFNYTYSRAIDWSSQSERVGSAGIDNYAQIINTWQPDQLRGVSDFNATHQVNSNYIWDIPVGRRKEFLSGVSRRVDAVIGGWQLTGIVRWTSGLPFGVHNGANWPTNWNIPGFETLDQPIPSAASARGQGNQRFADPAAVFNSFRLAYPGESGTRNPLLGDGYFEWDAGLNKTFLLTERINLQLRWEVFNVTNSVRFDPQSINANYNFPNLFGVATAELTQPRDMQLGARLTF